MVLRGGNATSPKLTSEFRLSRRARASSTTGATIGFDSPLRLSHGSMSRLTPSIAIALARASMLTEAASEFRGLPQGVVIRALGHNHNEEIGRRVAECNSRKRVPFAKNGRRHSSHVTVPAVFENVGGPTRTLTGVHPFDGYSIPRIGRRRGEASCSQSEEQGCNPDEQAKS